MEIYIIKKIRKNSKSLYATVQLVVVEVVAVTSEKSCGVGVINSSSAGYLTRAHI